jgi:hypothetical protein
MNKIPLIRAMPGKNNCRVLAAGIEDLITGSKVFQMINSE